MTLCGETENVNGILVLKSLRGKSLERRRRRYEDTVGWSLGIKIARPRGGYMCLRFVSTGGFCAFVLNTAACTTDSLVYWF
jgi:hypothetical protein